MWFTAIFGALIERIREATRECSTVEHSPLERPTFGDPPLEYLALERPSFDQSGTGRPTLGDGVSR